jgi:hypothetical protein
MLVLVALGGCYLPSAFEADLRITPDGDYNFQYQGLLVHLPLLEKLADPALSAAEAERRVAAVEQDLARDRGFEEITYLDRATFRVRYKRVGNIQRERSFSFVRAGARILAIERRGDGTVLVQADKPNTELATRLEKDGVTMQGRLRIQTEAPVSRHNAQQIVQIAAPVYVWQVDGFEQPSPSLVLVARPTR